MRVFEVANQYREQHPSIKPLVSTGNCKIQCSGKEMREMHGVVAAAISALSSCDAEILLITSSEVDFSILITPTQIVDAIAKLNEAFGL